MSTPIPGPTWAPDGNNFLSDSNPDDFESLKRVYGWNGTTASALGLTPEQKNLTFIDVKGQQQTPQCPKADDIPMNDSLNDIENILKGTGASEQCIKDDDFYATESSGSMRGKVDTILGSAEAEAKFMTQEKNDRKRQVGCGALLVTSTNIVSKQKAMQCIVNSCKQDTNITLDTSASVTIETLELTPLQATQLAKLNNDIIQERNQMIQSDNTLLTSLRGSSIDQMNLLTKFIANRTALMNKAQKQQLYLYDRSITIRGTSIRVAANTQLAATIALSTEAQNKLSSLANDISKDVAQMEVANKLGVNAQDPVVKQIINQNSSKSISTSSSSITEIAQNTSIKSETKGVITISAPGNITLENTTVDADICATIVVQQIMAQAVSNGLTLASQTLTDNKSVGKVLNDVKGLDDYQNAVNEAIKAGTNASPGFGSGSSSMIKYIIIGVVLLAALGIAAKMFSGGSGQSPIVLSRFRTLGNIGHKLQYKMEPFDSIKKMSTGEQVGLGVVLALIIGAFIYVLAK